MELNLPIYAYSCPEHGEYEVLKSMRDYKRNEPCPECGKVGWRKYSCNWKSFVGSVTYDKLNNYPPGTSAGDYTNRKDAEDW